ncbi:hypothetical protein BDF14DRAFT_1828192 [Spinellus fusiger]|nr:hypothetical protein BDF14DRAFT_1828192 [Spinellus fusiger]
MLAFQKNILTDIVEDDMLVIITPGLGLFSLLCEFIQLYTQGQHLVFLLNTTPAQDAAIQEYLMTAGVDPDNNVKTIVFDTLAETRRAMYCKGGIFSITSQILAVDMLSNRVPIPLISGFVIANAHRIKSDAMEQLILSLYREENEQGFIKAFSDQPLAFVSGFAPLQNALKALHLRKVQLWPRFHAMVSDELTTTQVDVVELRQPMTPAMECIQRALVECMEATLSELRRQVTLVDIEQFTVENSFFKSFDAIVRHQLAPVWHKVTPTCKKFVDDLGYLRRLLRYLTEYDAVSFHSFMETVVICNIPTIESPQLFSQWLLMDESDVAITAARKRVYLKPNDSDYTTAETWNGAHPSHLPAGTKLVLEDLPKWELLRDILEEIERDMKIATSEKGAPILIMANEFKTCSQIRQRLTEMNSPEKEQSTSMMAQLTQMYFLQKEVMSKAKMSSGASSTSSSRSSAGGSDAYSTRNAMPFNKRRRIRGGSTVSAKIQMTSKHVTDILKSQSTQNSSESSSSQSALFLGSISSFVEESAITQEEILSEFTVIPKESTITIQCYDNDTNERLLKDTEPLFIIMYDPNPAFVRCVEIYRATHPHLNVRVYFMVYENSVEEQRYLHEIRREKEAFEQLIREKSNMVIPMASKRVMQDDAFLKAVDTRLAGGQMKAYIPKKIIIDTREFRNPLPPILYAHGMQLIPCTLSVGDYILSPDMCVERKSISDLISSFTSGRLYTQCESMSEHYKVPILLIEFDASKAATFQSLSEVRETIVGTDISSKLILLTLTFPKLRVIWSSSQQETAAIFTDLKKLQEEPSVEVASAVGASDSEEIHRIHNITPQEMLLSMPGVTSANHQIIIRAVNSLEDLCKLEESELRSLIGEESARKLYSFLHKSSVNII